MTYHYTSSHELAEWPAEADWSYQVDPGYRGDRIDPPEAPYAYDVALTEFRVDGKAVDCPDWLATHLMPTAEELIQNASDSLEQAACDAAEYRRELREDAA
jgi:hypothetical protein